MGGGKPPAILLGGGLIALAVARSLAVADVAVHALGHRDDPLRHSRHRSSFTDVGAGDGMSHRMLEWLEAGTVRGVLLPCSDEGVELVGRNRQRLQELGYIPVEANDEAMLDMLDKVRTYERAVRAGIEAPWVGSVSTPDEALAAARRGGFPVALKPRHSHQFAHRFGAAKKAFVVADEAALEQALALTLDLGLEMMVAEIVPGPDDFRSCYSYIDEKGEPLWAITKRKLRQLPPGFGPGTYHITDWNPAVAELGLRFFRGVGVRGLVNVEFKVDERDDQLKLIECNHRFTAATEQLRRCGADLPLFAYNRLAGLAPPDPTRYRRGVGLWYPVRDARAFLAYRRRGDLTLRTWLRTLAHPQTFPLASIDDPLPSLVALSRRAIRFARARGRGRSLPSPSDQAPEAGIRSTTSRLASSTNVERAESTSDGATSPTKARTVR
jgi:D-aspartate ligase